MIPKGFMRALFIRPRQPAITGDVSIENCRKLALHRSAPPAVPPREKPECNPTKWVKWRHVRSREKGRPTCSKKGENSST